MLKYHLDQYIVIQDRINIKFRKTILMPQMLQSLEQEQIRN